MKGEDMFVRSLTRCIVFLAVVCASAMSAAGAALEDDFKTPPREAGVYAWWHWVGYNVSKKGISGTGSATTSARRG